MRFSIFFPPIVKDTTGVSISRLSRARLGEGNMASFAYTTKATLRDSIALTPIVSPGPLDTPEAVVVPRLSPLVLLLELDGSSVTSRVVKTWATSMGTTTLAKVYLGTELVGVSWCVPIMMSLFLKEPVSILNMVTTMPSPAVSKGRSSTYR